MICRYWLHIFTIVSLCLFASIVSAEPNWVKGVLAESDEVGDVQDADAIVLLHEVGSKINKKGQIKTRVRIATKVLTSAGLIHAALSEVISPTRKVKNLKGWHRNSLGKVESLKEEYIFEIGIQLASGRYDEVSTIAAAFPDAQPGDVIAYEYKIEEKDKSIGYYQAQILQGSLPTRRIRYSLTIPDGWQLHYSGKNLEPMIHHVSENLYVWEAENLPGRPDEPYMPPWGYLLRRLDVSCFNPEDNQARQFRDWQAVGSWAWDIHEGSTLVSDSLEHLATTLCEGLAKPSDKLCAIAEFVRDEIRYVAVEIGEGRFRPRVASSTLFNRYGDCKDKVTLMRAMLRIIGIPSAPALALLDGTVDSLFPTPFQFNHVIIAIPLDSVSVPASLSNEATVDRWLLFDPTDPSNPLGSLSASLKGTSVLIVSESDGALHVLPQLQPEDRCRQFSAEAILGEDNSLSASVRITSLRALGTESGYIVRTTPVEELIKNYHKKFAACMTNPVISNFLSGTDADSSWVSFDLTGEAVTTETGDFALLKLNFFHADSPHDLSRNKRIHPFWFGRPSQVVTDVKWSLPSAWSIEKVTDSAESSCDIARIRYQLTGTESTCRLRTVEEYSGGLLSSEEFEDANDFLRDLESINSRRVFITRTVAK